MSCFECTRVYQKYTMRLLDILGEYRCTSLNATILIAAVTIAVISPSTMIIIDSTCYGVFRQRDFYLVFDVVLIISLLFVH